MTAMPPRLESLPDPALAALVAGGDMHAADVLVRRHEGLVRSVVTSFRPGPPLDPDDLMQAGRWAIVRATPGWNPRRGSKLTTYLATAVVRAVQDERDRRLREYAREAPADPTPPGRATGGDGDRVRLDRVPQPDRAPPDVARLLAVLDGLTRDLVRAYFGLDGRAPRGKCPDARRNGLATVAARFGLTPDQADCLISGALERMRDVPI